jgi:outer membrane protein assembly factor BamD (BamD/ComL family)
MHYSCVIETMDRNTKYIFFFRYSLFCLAAVCVLVACHRRTQEQPQPEPVVDMAVVQNYYNQGLQFYADEKYHEAKHAWQQVIKMAPNTQLAGKSRLYVKKVNRMLQTLQDIEKKKRNTTEPTHD